MTAHLERENPELLEIVRGFRRLDKVAHKLGLLDPVESYATKVTWWPLVSVLGTFSSGKSTFINGLLGVPLQASGNQAVDDKFTVICYGTEASPRVLPGLALDSDPRFPFYKISGHINEVAEGEGQRLDSYLQLKTVHSEEVRGKIIIDSPGFDADAQRTSTLKITDHIIDLSDLVLVFFDARHPEPGVMQDTLEHLVTSVLRRPDFNKFLYILNQIDNAAREDNAEEVFAAWQRALAAKGLTAGKFYRIYDAKAALPIENEHLRRRFEAKRDEDMREIRTRIDALDVERSYRIAARLEQIAKRTRDEFVPRLEAARRSWRRRVWILDALVFGALAALLIVIGVELGYITGLDVTAPWISDLVGNPIALGISIAVILALVIGLNRVLRRFAARKIIKRLRSDVSLGEHAESVAHAFEKNVRSWRPFFLSRPVGWGMFTRRRLDEVLTEADRAVQKLNDLYASPSGRDATGAAIAPPAETTPATERGPAATTVSNEPQAVAEDGTSSEPEPAISEAATSDAGQSVEDRQIDSAQEDETPADRKKADGDYPRASNMH